MEKAIPAQATELAQLALRPRALPMAGLARPPGLAGLLALAAHAASPHAAHARTPLSPRLQPLPHGPRTSATPIHSVVFLPHAAHASDQAPTALAGAGQGGHARGMALSPWRRAHATTRGRWMQARAFDRP